MAIATWVPVASASQSQMVASGVIQSIGEPPTRSKNGSPSKRDSDTRSDLILMKVLGPSRGYLSLSRIVDYQDAPSRKDALSLEIGQRNATPNIDCNRVQLIQR